MPYTLVHKGVMREFDFYAPLGWQHWFWKAWTEHQRFGLPLVVALHGGAQDPLEFQRNWFFPRVWNLGLDNGGGPGDPVEPGADRFLENQFFVLYPYGMGWTTESLWTRAYLGIEPPQNLAPRTLRAWNAGFGGWNSLVKDVSFIQAAVNTMNEMLKAELMATPNELPSNFPWELWNEGEAGLFDPDRRFLFGFSNGAMMAYRLVKKMPDYWAALWSMAGTCGGKPHIGRGEDDYSIVNLPNSGQYGVSLFAHHGDIDNVVPPGDWDEPDFSCQAAESPNAASLMWEAAGFSNAPDYRTGYLPLSQAARSYSNYNNLAGAPEIRDRDGLAGPGTAQSKSLPDGPDPNAYNPTVVIYRDPNMSHGGFVSHANRYFSEKEVWRFFVYHPKVSR